MIGAENLRMDGRLAHMLAQRLGHNKVIDAPPCVVFARMEAIGPPAVRPRFIWMQRTEGIYKARV